MGGECPGVGEVIIVIVTYMRHSRFLHLWCLPLGSHAAQSSVFSQWIHGGGVLHWFSGSEPLSHNIGSTCASGPARFLTVSL